MPILPTSSSPILVPSPTNLPLGHYLRYTVVSKLAPSQIRHLDPLRGELATMLEHSTRVDPAAADPHRELVAVVQDLEHLGHELVTLALFPIAESVAGARNTCRIADDASLALDMLARWIRYELRLCQPQERRSP